MTATRVHVCPACGTRWTLTLNRGSKPMPWHNDPRCADCRAAVEPAATELAEPAPAPDLYGSLSALLAPPAPAPDMVAEEIEAAWAEHSRAEPKRTGIGTGYGTYPATRVCPRCDTEWTLLVDRPDRQATRPGTCGTCRTAAAHRANQLELPVGDMPGPWIADGLCAQTDPEIFHPEKGGTGRDAKAVCARCPVINPCRDWAVATQQQHGIWGGLNRRERAALAGEPTSEAVA